LIDRLLGTAIVITLLAVGAFAYVGYSGPPGAGKEVSPTQIVPPDQILPGGPPPDGIPSIDHPKFVSAANASSFLSDDYDWVIGIDYNGDIRAYPLQIMVWHEIVNDIVGGVPLAITYCPLCYSTEAFVRVVNGTTVQFGTSGKLLYNNLVMYDRTTKSLWSQIWGEAIAGPLAGHKLQKVSTDVLTWGEWKRLYTSTVVLSRQTGFIRNYEVNPYARYYNSHQISFPVPGQSNRLRFVYMVDFIVVAGLTLGNDSKAYVLENLTSPLWTDSVGGETILIWSQTYSAPCHFNPCIQGATSQFIATRFFNPIVNGNLLTFTHANGTIVDSETHSVWNFDGSAISGPLKGDSIERHVSETMFLFAWSSFHPNTLIYPP